VYAGQVPADTDMLTGWMATMRGFSAMLYAIMGTTPVFDGLAVSPGTGLTVTVGAGSITAHVAADTAAYGSLGTASDTIMKFGNNHASTTLGPFTAPNTSGQSVNILIQAGFSETDTNAALLPYMNAANPSVPFGGPGNNGVSQPTLRQQSVALSYVAGTPAATGSQATPAATTGNVPIAVVTIAYGQSSIVSGDISVPSNAPIIPWKLPQLTPGFSRMQVFGASGTFVVPNGVTQVKVTVIGGGGAGGASPGGTYPGGGGGAGGQAIGIVSGLTPGAGIAVTVPAGAGTGSNGGTASFGSYLSATGGVAGASNSRLPAGGIGGSGVGGTLNIGGSYGTDGDVPASRGGDGGGPGSGRGTTGTGNGQNATGPGGGGGGSATWGLGGTGGPGLVVVEY
jgi:hypothetical protein